MVSGITVPEWLGALVLYTAYSGFIGFIPYGIVCLLLLRWALDKSVRQFKCALLLSPVLMLPLFLIFILIISFFRFGIESTSDYREVLLFYSPFVLGFGYGYVGLVLGAVFLFRRVGVILPRVDGDMK